MAAHRSDFHKKITFAGALITIGIIFGDIGTSPLYVMKAILGEHTISEDIVLGALSCVFWTISLQTTFKYIFLTIEADNHGEGGIFALYALVRRYRRWLFIPTIIGAATLLGDGIITPAISISSAVEGLEIIFPSLPVFPIIVCLLIFLFIIQQFGTKFIGKAFGPMMVIWFTMIAIIGILNLSGNLDIIRALNPYYAYNLLSNFPGGFWFLGGVFLCTTGAEALFADLGHCGRQNIRISWLFVKTCLLLNYFGQGAYLLNLTGTTLQGGNPFYNMMPEFFLPFGILIATCAAFIASQALISGAYTLISEAITLNFFPKLKINYPSDMRGQIYLPAMNWLLLLSCLGIQFYFKTSHNMEAAYGFSISVTMLMTTILMYYYMKFVRKFPSLLTIAITSLFLTVEFSFFITNIIKIGHLWAFLIFESFVVTIMYVYYRSRQIKNKLTPFIDLHHHLENIVTLSENQSIPKYTSHLIYLSKANLLWQIEQKIISSIFSRKPKRADIYWILHVERTDEPFTMDYRIDELINDKLIKVELRLGFKIPMKVQFYFKHILKELIQKNTIPDCHDPKLDKYRIEDDFKFVIIEQFLSSENEFTVGEGFVLNSYFWLKDYELSEEKAFGIEPSEVIIEKIPLIVKSIKPPHFRQIPSKSN